MATILDINTDELRSAVGIAEQANEQITEAMNSLNRVVIHTDWVCPERDTINNNTINNQKNAGTIQSNSSSFYSAIKASSERFDEVEQNSISRTNTVDGAIAGIVNVVRSAISAGGTSPSIADFGNISGNIDFKGGGGGHSF